MDLTWSEDKNNVLKSGRGVSFEDIEEAIHDKRLLMIADHPNPLKYPGQKLMYVVIEDYVYCVPFVREKTGGLFLKTIYPSSKMTKYLLRGEKCKT